LVNLISVEDNWGLYRKAVAGCISSNEPCVPYIGVYLKDLVSIEDGLQNVLADYPGNVINMEKRRKVASIIGEVLSFQRRPYTFAVQALPSVCLQLACFSKLVTMLKEDELYELSKQLEPKKNSSAKVSKK
jgi:son of sevenless